MDDRTTLLFALPDFRVLDVTAEPDGGRRVLVEGVAEQGGCPECGVMSGLVKDRPTSRVKDLPHGPVPLRVWVRKRRFACAEVLCTTCAIVGVGLAAYKAGRQAKNGRYRSALTGLALEAAPGGLGRGFKVASRYHSTMANKAHRLKNYYKKRGQREMQAYYRNGADFHRGRAASYGARRGLATKGLALGIVAHQGANGGFE